MLNEYFSIGETSKLTNISIDRLRNYHKINLIKPIYIAKNNNYRYYSKEQLRSLRIINYMRKIGMPLDEIKLIFNKHSNSEECIDLLNKRIETIEEQIKTLELVKEDILSLKFNMEHSLKNSNESKIVFKEIEERYIFKENTHQNFNFTFDHREYFLAHLRKKLISSKVGSIIEKGFYAENFYDWKNCCGSIYLNTHFKNEHNFILPKGKYLCVSYQNEQREEIFEKALSYIKENNIQITGLFVNIVLLILPKEKFQLQVLIKP